MPEAPAPRNFEHQALQRAVKWPMVPEEAHEQALQGCSDGFQPGTTLSTTGFNKGAHRAE